MIGCMNCSLHKHVEIGKTISGQYSSGSAVRFSRRLGLRPGIGQVDPVEVGQTVEVVSVVRGNFVGANLPHSSGEQRIAEIDRILFVKANSIVIGKMVVAGKSEAPHSEDCPQRLGHIGAIKPVRQQARSQDVL